MMNMEKQLRDLEKAMELVNPIYDKVMNLSETAFLSLMGTLVDMYASGHDRKCMDLHKILYESAGEVFEELGEFRG